MEGPENQSATPMTRPIEVKFNLPDMPDMEKSFWNWLRARIEEDLTELMGKLNNAAVERKSFFGEISIGYDEGEKRFHVFLGYSSDDSDARERLAKAREEAQRDGVGPTKNLALVRNVRAAE